MCSCPIVSKEMLTHLRKEYPVGTRVKLIKMEDKQAPPINTIGTVTSVDDIGTIHVKWESGSSLGVTYGVDTCEKV